MQMRARMQGRGTNDREKMKHSICNNVASETEKTNQYDT